MSYEVANHCKVAPINKLTVTSSLIRIAIMSQKSLQILFLARVMVACQYRLAVGALRIVSNVRHTNTIICRPMDIGRTGRILSTTEVKAVK